MLRSDRAAAMPFIMAATLIDMITIGLIIPVLPALVGTFTGSQADQAYWYGAVTLAFGFANFLSSPVLGALSDAYGRRPVLLLGFFGLALSFLATALATAMWMLIAVRLISGALMANISVSNAYVADITPPEDRGRRFGMLGAMFGIGFILGPVIGGLLGAIDVRLPFFAAGSLALVNFLYGYFVLPESLPPERRSPFSWKRANPLGSLRLLRSHPELFGLASVTLLYYVAHEVLPSTFVLYTQYRYGWDIRTVGLTLAAVGICTAIVSGGLVGPIVARIGERRAALTGLVFGAAAFAIYGLAPVGRLFLAGVPVMAFWGLYGPSAQGIMSKRVSGSEQGQLQGAMMGLRGLAGLFSPFIFTFTFATFINPRIDVHLPGAPFLLAALLLVAAFALAIRVTANARRDARIAT
jgi:DHA1 family tetracycline resistance protein-like MFS transporter